MRWFLLALAACSQHEPPPPPPATPPPAPPPVQHMATDHGSCELTIGGETEKIIPSSAAVGNDLALNCIGKLGRVSFRPGTPPTGPTTYKIERTSHDVVLLARARDKQLGNVEGTIDVTALDAHHVAGTIDLVGTSGSGRVTIAGSFDFPRQHE
jgi:hypothetical protein